MITSAFLNLFWGIIALLLSFLSDVSTSSSITTAISTTSGYLTSLNSFIPYILGSVLSIIAFDLVFESSYLLFKVIYWVIRRFPTQS